MARVFSGQVTLVAESYVLLRDRPGDATRTIKFSDIARTIDRRPTSRHLWGVLTGAVIAVVPVFIWLYAHCFYAC